VSQYCDVALPVPLDRAFTYELGGLEPEVGARVVVPFAGQRLVGVVVKLHDVPPKPEVEGQEIQVKRVQQVLDDAALLPDELMELGKWIAGYYCAPLGEVLRGMMPLTAEVRRQWVYKIGEQGRKVLNDAAVKGASRRSKLSAEDQNREYAVLNYLVSGEVAKAATIRSATGANKALLDAMARKKWLARDIDSRGHFAAHLDTVQVLRCEPGQDMATGVVALCVAQRRQRRHNLFCGFRIFNYADFAAPVWIIAGDAAAEVLSHTLCAHYAAAYIAAGCAQRAAPAAC